MKIKNKSERGQVIIFIVLGFVLILAFTGLAIDGGLVYSARRNAQNAADAASLAGGGAAASYMENHSLDSSNWSCASTALQNSMWAAINTSIARAASNGFTIDSDWDVDWNGVETRCEANAYYNNGIVERYIDVIVRITTTTDPIFVSFFTQDDVVIEVEAVTRVRPRMPLAYGNAVVALNEGGCNAGGLEMGGSGTSQINGGGFWSNGCLRSSGNAWNSEVVGGGVVYVSDTAGNHWSFENDDGVNIPPAQADTPLPPETYAVPTPDCSATGAQTMDKITVNGGDYLLTAGLYCLTGSSEVIKLTGSATLTGYDVTFYIPNGYVSISGNQNIKLTAPVAATAVNGAMSGILFYVTSSDNNALSIEGNSFTDVRGLIYVPNSRVILSGASGMTTPANFNTQIVARDVTITGNTDVNIYFDNSDVYKRPTWLELAK